MGDKILIFTQPSNSPDLNINDLGFFRALQAYFSQFCPKTTEEIVEYVLKAHELYPKERINHIWLSLMTVMNEIIDSNGDNDYKIPHIGKERLEREGRLPVTLAVTDNAFNNI